MMTRRFVWPVLLAVLLFFSGCASAVRQTGAAAPSGGTRVERQNGAVKAQAAKPAGQVSRTEKKTSVEELSLPDFSRPSKPGGLPEARPISASDLVHAKGPVEINAEDMALNDFIIYALGETLKVTFFIDEHVKNMKTPVTLMMTSEMPADKVFDIVVGFLEKQGLSLEEKSGALYITKAGVQAGVPSGIGIGTNVPLTSANVLQVVPLKYASTRDLDYVIKEMYKTSVTVKTYPRGNALLLAGPAGSVRDIVDFIKIFDTPYLKGRKAFLLKLTYWYTDEFIDQMSKILEGVGFPVAKSPGQPGILFVPIRFLNSVLVLAPDEKSAQYVIDWDKRLDTPESAGKSMKAYTYSPKYSKASDLVDAVSKLYGAGVAEAPRQSSKTERGRGASTRGRNAGVSRAAAAVSAGGISISADDKRNLILIRSTPAEYQALLRYLDKLDLPPRQVLIQATIAELTLNGDLAYGLEWYIKNRMAKGDYTLQTLNQLGLTTTKGLTYQFVTDSQRFQAAINAFEQEDRIHILSRPRLMVLDNEEATIEVGTQVPIVTSEVSTTISTNTPNILRNVQYRDTGTILKIKPTINTGGLLTLQISQEESQAQTNTTSDIDSPLILTRRINTTVVSGTGQTIILGGMMSDTKSSTVIKVPLLGDIPILGNLFRTTSTSDQKTELIVLIKPIILTNTNEAAKITDEFRQDFKWLQ